MQGGVAMARDQSIHADEAELRRVISVGSEREKRQAGIRAEAPETPARQPGIRAEAPETPARQPGIWAEVPETPARQPGILAEAPESPARQPGILAEASETPARQPGIWTEVPETPARQPRILAEVLETPHASRTPTAFHHPAQGCAPRATLGQRAALRANPERVTSRPAWPDATPLGLARFFRRTQSRRLPAPPGAALRAACGRLCRSAPFCIAPTFSPARPLASRFRSTSLGRGMERWRSGGQTPPACEEPALLPSACQSCSFVAKGKMYLANCALNDDFLAHLR